MERLRSEIALIHNRRVREFIEEALQMAPSYFWTTPSSTTGKNHPPDEQAEGGRVLHVKRVARLCAAYAEAWTLSTQDRDCLIAAGILHDIVVRGTGDEPLPHTDKAHDTNASEHLRSLSAVLPTGAWGAIFTACDGHMGRWGNRPHLIHKHGSLAHLLHMADLTASQSWVMVEPLLAGD